MEFNHEEPVEYRDGDDEESPQDTSVEGMPQEEVTGVTPEVAILVLMTSDGRVDLITDTQGFMQTRRNPTLGDIRNMASTIAADAQTQIIAATAAKAVSDYIQKNLLNIRQPKMAGSIPNNEGRIILPRGPGQ